jgi:hypothetical protein
LERRSCCLASAADLGDRHNGHIDALMVALAMAGLWLFIRLRPLASAVAVTLGLLETLMGAPGQVDLASRNPAVNRLSGGDQDLSFPRCARC